MTESEGQRAEADTERPPDPLIGSTIAGRYRIEALLGSGGMGAVYRAEHVHMKKTVALKVLHKELAGIDEIVARFEREAIAAGRIEHPNVAPATDFGKLEDGSFYLVLEYVDGKSLRALLDEGKIGWERAVAVAKQIAAALVAAHGAGIVHRDLKPDNVMLVPLPEGGERAKVLDFGIARVSLSDASRDATNLTKLGVVMGTVAYMSPEQALGQEVDERTDLYALGVILHEMITGQAPFHAETAAQILAKQLTASPPPLPAGTPAALGTLVAELLRNTANERPASARAVLERLEAITRAPPPAIVFPAVVSDPRRLVVIGVGVAAAVVGLALVLLFTGDEPAEPEALGSASAAATAPNVLVGNARVESASPRSASSADGDAGNAAEAETKAVTSAEPVPSSSVSGPAKPAAKKKTQGGASKKRTGPGGIYIPPPSEWF